MRTPDMNTIFKGIAAAGLVAALAACGSGLSSMTAAGTGSSGSSSGGGSNNTPPGIPNSIVFVPPATGNNVIALQGTGGNTNAQVTFQVDDASSTGVAGVTVTFSLIPATGDATLTTANGTTGANGQVSTFVVSGNEHYSVTVQAQITLPSGIKTTANSNALTISTGIPTQGNFAMAAASLTANNADSTLGVTDSVTVQLSDRFNNPAPDGTAVAFVANIGQIPGQCRTANGSCTVTWTSSGNGIYNLEPHVAGHVEILAYTVGEESFTDVDGDGVFDNSDTFSVNSGTGDAFDERFRDPATNDIGEVYLDGDESGAYISGEFFHDFNNDRVRNGPDAHFYGFGCKGTPTVPCGSTSTKEIGKQICIGASTSHANITSPASPVVVSGTGPSGVNVTFTVSDQNGQALASGTQVVLNSTITNGSITLPTNLPFTYQDSGCGADVRSFTVNIAQTQATPPAVPLPVNGTIQLKVITPGLGGAETDSPVIVLQ